MMRSRSNLKSLFDHFFPKAIIFAEVIIQQLALSRKSLSGKLSVRKKRLHHLQNYHRRAIKAGESAEYEKAFSSLNVIAHEGVALLKTAQKGMLGKHSISDEDLKKASSAANELLQLEAEWRRKASEIPPFRIQVTDAALKSEKSESKLDFYDAALRQEALDSGFWDEEWYLSQYYGSYRLKKSELKGSRLFPLDYYLTEGWKLGHEPCAEFPLHIDEAQIGCSKLEYFLKTLRFSEYAFETNPWIPSAETIANYQSHRVGRKSDKVVYCCILESDEDLVQPYQIDFSWDYICFTDHLSPGQIGVWEIRPLKERQEDATKTEVWYKIHPHLVLPDYKESLYLGNHLNVLSSYLFDSIQVSEVSLLLSQHPLGSTVQEVIESRLSLEGLTQHEVENLEDLRRLYKREAFPYEFGLADTQWIYRRHEDVSVQKLMAAWWQLVTETGGSDELSLPYVCREFNYALDEHLIGGCGVQYMDFWQFKNLKSTEQTKVEEFAPVDLSKIPYLQPAFASNNIASVFSTNEAFIPYLAITIFSLIQNRSENYNYDIIILSRDVPETAFEKILKLAEGRSNVSIRLYNTTALIETVPTSLFYIEGRVPVETYNKCFITEILRGYDRCLYLDSDLLIRGDVQELHDMDLKGNSIGASVNIANVYAAYYHRVKKGKLFHEYLTKDLGIADHSKYFQAGVLVLDMKKLESLNLRALAIQALKKIKTPIFFDQCLFNSIFYQDTCDFSTTWNHVWYMQPYSYLRGAVKDSVFFDYARGRLAPKIIHYAGKNKPQSKLGWALSDQFWDYAYDSPFLEDIKKDVLAKDNEVSKALAVAKDREWYKVKPRVLVHLHLYYTDQLGVMIEKLKSIHQCDFDLFVTMVEKDFAVEAKILAQWKNAKILIVQNAGYDVYPFLQVLNEVNITHYDYILKVHTKNLRDAKKGKVYGIQVPEYRWRDELLYALLGSKKIFAEHLRQLESDLTLGCIGAGRFIFSTENHQEEEKYQLAKWRKKSGITGGTHYIGGTMFLARAYPFERVKGLNLHAADFASESMTTKDHKNTAHIFERLFGLIIESEGFEIRPGAPMAGES